MKSRTIVIKRKYLLFILILLIVLLICFLISKKNIDIIEDDISNNTYAETICIKETVVTFTSNYKAREAYKNMPQNIDGYEVIGKLEIPKIELTTYVLSETNKNTLNKSVTKLCGPKVNGVGNFCITGHNYKNDKMFYNLKKLEATDKISFSDIYDNIVEYIVYDKYKVKPDEVECLSQETEGERELTLITCTTGAIKRLVIKAIEVYD